MTGQPFLRPLLGANSSIVLEAAFGADPSDVSGAGWVWTDITNMRNDPGVSVTIGRADNVSQTPAAVLTCVLNNAAGDYTPTNPLGAFYPNVKQNTPIRLRQTLDGINFRTRFQGKADTWNPTYNTKGNVRAVALRALGKLNELAGLKKPVASALTSAILAHSPACAWPLEDPAGSTSAASLIAGVAPLTVNKAVPFGVPGPPGAASAADLSNGALVTATLPASSATSFRLEVSLIAPDTDAYSLPIGMDMSGDLTDLDVQISSAGINVHTEFADASTPRNDAASADINDGLWHRLRFDVAQSGADITYALSIDGVSVLAVTLAGRVFGQPWTFSIGGTTGTLSSGSRLAASGLALCQPSPGAVVPDTVVASGGYAGEAASARLSRFCTDQGIDLVRFGFSDNTMGPQPAGTRLVVLRDCEATDHGMLYDGLSPGVRYQCRSVRYGQAPALTLDMAAAEVSPPFTPIFDRQAVHNTYKVTRAGGSSATYEDVTGPLGTALIGVDGDAEATVNIDSDTPLISHAAWLVSLGTVDGFRFPTITLDLLNAPSRAADLLLATAAGPGFRLTVNNPHTPNADLPNDPIDVIVEGWTEQTTADTWRIVFNCSPYAPNAIATVGDTVGRVDSTSATTGTTWTTTVTGSKFVAMDVSAAWTTDGGDVPFDINIGGERITISAIGAWAGGGQNFTVSARSVNGVVKTHAVGEAVSVWTDLTIGL